MTFPQRGNILFMILLAIILFAALAYAVNSGMRGGTKPATTEKAETLAADMAQYATLLGNTVNRLKLTNGCTDAQINFVNTVAGGYSNPNAPADKKCNVFDPAGGSMAWKSIAPEALDPYFANAPWGTSYGYGQIKIPNNASYRNIGTFNGTTPDPSNVDMVVAFPFVTDAVCRAINERFGLPYPLASLSSGYNKVMDNGQFTGSFSSCLPSNCNYAYTLQAPDNSIATSMDFCAYGQWGYAAPETKNFNVYVHIMVAR